ncbi:disease resistance protein Pik-2-like [Hordeum vulgare subsp. vulgare]|uniref:Uncharacterized protein n=1 Tax=Hordeum vulgare subsp. vulgare TaxID=112509 RepID=A0A8I6XSP6_HORVV|nr:disease resistance protein Pik-2-like [Hordeum vulgare subsp. vulgare]
MERASVAVLSNVVQLVGQEFRQLHTVRGEVTELRDELATMNTLLRMQSEADASGLSHFVREWMNQIRELAYDAEDCVDLYLFRISCPTGDGSWYMYIRSKTKHLLATLFPRRRLARDIRALRDRAVVISERHARYGVSLELLKRTDSSDLVPRAVVASARALRPHHDPNQLFVGVEARAKNLVNKLKVEEGVEEDKELKVIFIVGFGGLGKTTLAMEVCRQLETEFPRQAKVSVSQTFGSKDLEGLLKRVLRQVVTLPSNEKDRADLLDKIDRMDAGELQLRLGKDLQNNRYLILIDDVWSTSAWDSIQSRLPSNNMGSRIIVTTRTNTLAKATSNACDYYIHRMEVLDRVESKQLFMSKTFGSMSEDSFPDDLKDDMEVILKKCGGLPLAIISIASLLSSYNNSERKKMWEIVGRSIGSQMESNPTLEGMRQILTLSYDHLPHHLKACMMYLCIFPEDYVIYKDRLLKRWIAEGLIPEKRGMTQMELAEECFSELMSRSMIDQASDIITTYQWREETCRVHDIMLEVMVSKSLESNFVSLVGGQYEGMAYDRIRRLTIHGGVEAIQESSSKKRAPHRGTRNGIKGMNMQHVRSLSIFDTEAPKLLARLEEFTLLRVLDLEDCKGLEEKYMKHICRMYLLRFLSLKGTDIKDIPERIGDLEHLHTLDVRQTRLKGLPETVTKLEKLEHLLFTTKGILWSAWMLPKGISKMKALRRLNKVIVIDDVKVAKEIGELDQLQELCIYVNTRNKDMNRSVPEELASSVSKLNMLQWLDIGNFGCEDWPFKRILQFLHVVKSPPQLLRYFRICGCLDELPDWVEKLTNLIEFDIAWAYLDGAHLFDVLCKLPNLQRLTLGAYFIRKNQDMVARSSQCLRELKELTLGYSPEVPPVYVFEKGCMPNLETLVLYFLDQWKTIVGIEHLTNLKEVQISCVKEGALAAALEVLKVENEKRRDSKREEIRVIVR